MSRNASQQSLSLRVAFHGILLFCILIILSMPVLPTTDGPIHRYYVGVLHDVLIHNGSGYDQAYAIRHPLPPYAMQYLIELGLAQGFSLSNAEKIFAVLTLVITAYGFRSAARALGRNGDTIALGVSCLLLPWSLWMGFFNYTMAVGLSLVALSLWLRVRAGHKKLWPLFGAMCLLTMMTHPVPLLILLLALLLDFIVITWQERGSRVRLDVIGSLAFVTVVALYPFLIGEGTHTGPSLHDYGFHLKRIARQLLLFGLSPYAVGSRAVLPNLYRLSIYAVAAMAVYLGWTGWKQALRRSSLGFVNLLLPAGGLLGLSILILPDSIRGSFFFATRMITFVWIALLLSASDVDFSVEKTRRVWLVATGGMFAMVLLSAKTLIVPVARQITALEAETVPAGGAGLVIDPSQDLQTKLHSSLAFAPYHWAGVIPLTQAHQLMLDSPWLEQTNFPLTSRSGSPLLNAQVSQQDAAKINLHDGTVQWMTPESLHEVLRNTSVIFYRTPFHGLNLSEQIGVVNAAQFSCLSRSWYLKCIRNTNDR